MSNSQCKACGHLLQSVIHSFHGRFQLLRVHSHTSRNSGPSLHRTQFKVDPTMLTAHTVANVCNEGSVGICFILDSPTTATVGYWCTVPRTMENLVGEHSTLLNLLSGTLSSTRNSPEAFKRRLNHTFYELTSVLFSWDLFLAVQN